MNDETHEESQKTTPGASTFPPRPGQAQHPTGSSAAGAAGTPTRIQVLSDAGSLVAYLRERLPPEVDPVAPSERVRAAGVLVPLYSRDGRPYLLFTLRSLTLAYHSGEISFPGGGREPGDASLAFAALRETEEELAIPPSAVEVLGALPPVHAVVSNNWVAPVVGWLGEGLPPLVPAPTEVAEVIEAPLAALTDPTIFHTEQWSRGGIARTLYFYDLGPYRIWGLTGWILTKFLGLLPRQ